MEHLGYNVSSGKNVGFNKESRGRSKLANADDAEGDS
jgi:hypothetical protein